MLVFGIMLLNSEWSADVGHVTQLSGGSQAVDKSSRDGVATKYRPVGVCTKLAR